MSAPTAAPSLIGAAPPPITRDRTAQAWAVAATISWAGDAVLSMALAWTAVHLAGAATAGVVLACAMLPQGLLMLLGGALADRLDTRRVMITGEASRLCVLIVAGGLWSAGDRSIAVLIGIGLCFGTVAGLSNPARSTLLRQLVRGDDLPVAIGWTQLGNRLATLAGAPLGAALVAGWGLTAAIAADCLTFAVVLVTLMLVVRPRYRLPRALDQAVHTALLDALRYLRRSPGALALVVALLAPNVFVGPAIDLGVPLRVSRAHWPAIWLGLIEAAVAVGAVAGSLAAMRWRTGRTVRRAFVALIGQGLGIVMLGVVSIPSVVTGALVIGVTAGLASVWASAAFQRVIDPRYLGRVSSVSQLGDLLLLPLVTPAYGALVGGSSLETAAVLFGVGTIAVNALVSRRPALATL